MITFILALFLGFILGRAHFGPRPQLVGFNLPFVDIVFSTAPFVVMHSFKLGPIYVGVSYDGRLS